MHGSRRAIWIISLLAGLSGCTHLQLSRSAVKQSESVTDLIYQQILDNLALFHCQPDALAHFAVVGTGGTAVNDHGEAGLELEWDPFSIVREQLGLSGFREIQEQWTLAPIVNPEKLRAIRCVFQIVANGVSTDPEADTLLQSFLGDNYFEWLPQGWYGVGCRKDVPRDALYVGHYGHKFVWVKCGSLDALTRLTIVVLNIATLDPNPPPAEPTKTVYRYERDADGNVQTMEILTRPDPDAPRVVPSQVRKDFYNPLQSQIQMQGR
ncbi:hypothetical protein [Planctomicrobium piriforme]|uniref:Lipoprotein n=1 Tax=Planctomicrobium piriforme TaxID=1576369 RepID=A0A1I3CG40_9PLAN|nr:hypothetical protein [Planctomicrobium piriforme]SFH73353.1 hypothetical protein SAMN05421753_102263 [Planctomicrobium piriforme]